jgi:SAM-dependent methyltransferase
VTDLRTPPVNDGDLYCERVRQYASERPLRRLNVLLAGCGWSAGPDLRSLDLGATELHVTGVDADTPALRASTEKRDDLDAWHLGDLRTVPMPPRAYDVVCAIHVVERLAHAELVLDRIVAALKPGGLLLVAFRDRDTAYGLLDRFIPSRVRGLQHAPPVVYEKIASYEGMRWYCGMRGLVIAEEHTVRSAQPGYGRWNRVIGAAAGLVEKVSGGRLTARHSDVSLVIRKPENRFARVI